MRTRVAAAVLVALVAAAAGCGGSSGRAHPATSYRVILTEFRFNPSAITVQPGTTTFFLVNQGTVAHDMVVETQAGERVAASQLVQPGNGAGFTVDLAAGSYLIVCDQPGHEAAGMKGTLSAG